MMLAGRALGCTALASDTPRSITGLDAEAARPIVLSVNGVMAAFEHNTISLDGALGEQRTGRFVLVNPDVVPEHGATVRVTYFTQVLFAGFIRRVKAQITSARNRRAYHCDVVDWSHLLTRHTVRRNFSEVPISTIVDSLLDNELAACGLSLGSVESTLTLPLVDSRGGSAFDVLREIATATGQILVIDAERRLHFRASTLPPAPLTLTESRVLDPEVDSTLDDYRNAQTVIVTGTAPEGSNETAITVIHIETNAEQIAERAAIDGTSGRYEGVDTVTHPLSNDPAQLQLLAQSYATAKLTVSGVPKRTLTCRVRGYGFEPGQIATVDLPTYGVVGSWVIQQARIQEEIGVRLLYELTLTETTLLRRAYDSWLRVIERGEIVVLLPGTIGLSEATFTTPGAHQWVSPIAGVITIVTMGGSGGGGGATPGSPFRGGRGGNSGKTISSVTVAVGDTLDMVVGTKGLGGAIFSDGTAGTATTVVRGSTTLSMAEGGGGGDGNSTGANGTPGGGSNGATTVGGGKSGGAGGTNAVGNEAGKNGEDGSVSIQY